jgi:hypothetical protein
MASQINPNDIDGAYPVAGQDNNSQGFRDNFTNTKTNFQYAANEITDLQNNVLLKSALNGTTLDNNMNGSLLYDALIQDFSATAVPLGNQTGSISINYASGHYQSLTTQGAITLSFVNFPPNPTYGYIKLQINVTNLLHTVTLPSAVTLGVAGIQGISPVPPASGPYTITFGATGVYEFAFGSYNGGSTITIFDLNRALTNVTSGTSSFANITASGTISAVGTVTGGNVITGGLISATGNISGGNIIGTVVGSVSTSGSVSATGNVSGGNVNGFVRPTTGTASQAPLVFTAGTNLSSALGGAMEYDGVVPYFTPAANRGVLSAQHFITLTSNYTATDGTSAQQVFNSTTSGAIALAATKTYLFDAVYYITRSAGATSRTLSVLFNSTNALTGIQYIAETTSTTGNSLGAVSRIYGSGVTATVVTAASTSTTENITVVLRGIIRTNLATTFTPQIQFSAVAGGAPSILSGSYFRLVSLGSSSVTSVGNWS